jgi:hypothetical protein
MSLPSRHAHSPRRRTTTLVLALLTTIAVAGCSGGAAESDASEISVSYPAPTTAAAPSPDTTTTAADVEVPDGEGAALLSDALSALGDSYVFTSEVSLDGEIVSAGLGRSVDGATEVALDQQGTTLTYRAIDVRRWVETPGGAWESLADSTESVSPLAGLGLPNAIEVVSVDGAVTTLSATYATDTLSMSTSGSLEVTLTLTVTDGVLASVTYEGELDGQQVQMISTFAPSADLEPIADPDA